MNVPMGVPYFQVRDILEAGNAKLFSGNHRLYRDISKRVFTVLKEYIPETKQYSVDEAFFPLVGSRDEVDSQAMEIKDMIEAMVGIPVSIGVSKSKTLAKVANGIAKKGAGTNVLDMEEWSRLRQNYGVEQIWGVGAGFSKRMREHSINTVEQYVTADPGTVKQLFGVIGQRLQSELNGVPAAESAEKPKQSIMSSRSFAEETIDLQILKDAVAHHVEQVAYELRQMQHKTKVLAVYIAPSRHGDFALYNRSKEIVFETGENSTQALTRAAFWLLQGMYEANVPYKKAGVRVASLEPVMQSQLRLFVDDATPESEADPLQEAIDSIHSKYETGRLHIGRLEKPAIYQGKAEKKSPSYTTRWSELKAVKAK